MRRQDDIRIGARRAAAISKVVVHLQHLGDRLRLGKNSGFRDIGTSGRKGDSHEQP